MYVDSIETHDNWIFVVVNIGMTYFKYLHIVFSTSPVHVHQLWCLNITSIMSWFTLTQSKDVKFIGIKSKALHIHFSAGHVGYPVFIYHTLCTLLSWSCRVSCIPIGSIEHTFCTLLSWSCRVSCILIGSIAHTLCTLLSWACRVSYILIPYTLHSSQLVMQGFLYSYTIHSALFLAGHAGYPVFLYHTLCTLLSWSCRVSCILIGPIAHTLCTLLSWSCRVSCILIPYTLYSSQLVMQGILYSYTIHSALFLAGHAGYPVFLCHTLCTLLSWSCRVSCILMPYSLYSSQLVMQGILYSYTIHSVLFSAGHAGYPIFLCHTLCTLLSWSCRVSCILMPYNLYSSQLVMQGILYYYTIHSALFSAGHAGYHVFLYHTLCTLLSWSCRVSCILIPYTLHSS